jgi:hypothetical protein
MYDIYLLTGVHTLPPLEDLTGSVPAFKAPEALVRFEERIQQRTPHFLQLDLDAQSAIKVFQYLRTGKAPGCILPAAYRQPRVSLEMATPLAEAEITELKAAHYPEQPAVPVRFTREEPVCWTFNATYGRNARLYARIDKLDGHIWQQEDIGRIWEMPYFLGEAARQARVPYIVAAPQGDSQQMYDIYLVRSAAKFPAPEDLASIASGLQEPALQQLMTQGNMNLLKVALPRDKALELLDRLEREGAWGSLISSAYRHPRLTREQASPLAERAIIARQAAQRPGDTLGPVRFVSEEPCCWTFGASSAQLISEDLIPGMVFASIDKLDGHVWAQEELERLTEEN